MDDLTGGAPRKRPPSVAALVRDRSRDRWWPSREMNRSEQLFCWAELHPTPQLAGESGIRVPDPGSTTTLANPRGP